MKGKSMETPTTLVDIQNSSDSRNIPIDKVGVRDVRFPISVQERNNGYQQTVGNFTLTVDLPREFKGTHMSRFLEALGSHDDEQRKIISPEAIPVILKDLKDRLHSATSHLEVSFTYFKSKPAPVTGKVGMMGYDVRFIAASGATDDFIMQVVTPVTTLCPCSKEISKYGAHNQRGYVTTRVRFTETVWIEDVIEAVEAVASCSLYPVLKRPDEKFVTETAYENPRFVEDMVREVAGAFNRDSRITWYEIEVENHESIHAHNAYATITVDKR